MKRPEVIKELVRKLAHKGYTSRFFVSIGLPLVFIGKGTLGPEMSWVSYLLTKYLVQHPTLFKNRTVLDMGCGSGIQLVTTALGGAKKVIGADFLILQFQAPEKISASLV